MRDVIRQNVDYVHEHRAVQCSAVRRPTRAMYIHPYVPSWSSTQTDMVIAFPTSIDDKRVCAAAGGGVAQADGLTCSTSTLLAPQIRHLDYPL